MKPPTRALMFALAAAVIAVVVMLGVAGIGV